MRFRTNKEHYARAIVTGVVVNIRATSRLGNKISKFEIFILSKRSQYGNVFSPKLAEYIDFKLSLKLISKLNLGTKKKT